MRSLKYSVIAVLGIAASVALIFLTIRGIGGSRGVTVMKQTTGVYVSETFPLDEVDNVDVEGVWRISIKPAEGDARLQLTAPREVVDEISAGLGSNINLSHSFNFRHLTKPFEAVIYADSIGDLSISGTSKVEMDGLMLDDFSIRVSGAGDIEASDVSVNNLKVAAEGAANIDFRDASAVNADIDISGAANVEITMGGGSLKCSLEGVGKIRYRGEVSDKDFRIDGLGSIDYLD